MMLGARLTQIQIIGIVGSSLLCGLAWVCLRFSEFGRHLRAVACDTSLAQAVGVNTERVYLKTALISSGPVALAGVVKAYDVGLMPTMGFSPLLMGFVAMMVGGVGRPLGGAIAAFLVATIQQIAVMSLPTQWQDTVVFAMLVIALLFRMGGVSGKSEVVRDERVLQSG